MYALGNARIRPFPFPHFYVDEVFPAPFYDRLVRSLPNLSAYTPIGEDGRISSDQVAAEELYRERHVITLEPGETRPFEATDPALWSAFDDWFLGDSFKLFLLNRFDAMLRMRFKDSLGSLLFHSDAQLIRDLTNYSLGPHVDHPRKVVVVIFYLPTTADRPGLGTSVYVPHDPAAHDDSGRHYAHEQFARVATMPYLPNSAFGFFKTANSFHGVERVSGPGERRDLIQLSISHTRPERGPEQR